MNKIVPYSLALVHLGWAISLIIDAQRYLGRLIYPPFFAILHMIVVLMIVVRRLVGGILSALMMAYYWFVVKPLEPIAEPQSVGIFFLSLSLLAPLMGKWMRFENLLLLCLRFGVAYPYLEWGLDAFRNPLHFYAYLLQNPFTRFLAELNLIKETVLILGFTELLISTIMLLGLSIKQFSALSIAVLVTFMVVAGYPLALPQNIALAAASIVLAKMGGGEYVIRSVPKLLRVLVR